MFLSSDLLMRLSAPIDGLRVPDEKQRTIDYTAEVVLRRSGMHQSFLDLSRCSELSARFVNRTVPQLCANLLYLDLSFTRCDDLYSIFQGCESLRTLNIAGLQLMDPSLAGIEALDQLEVLCLRGSNVIDISALSALEIIRSLDLGNTSLSVVGKGLVKKERLEELLLDGCACREVDQVLDAVVAMQRLKLMNIHEGDFAMKRTAIATLREGNPVFFEPYSRRLMYFDAVVRNDFLSVNRFLSSGVPVDIRAMPRDRGFFRELFHTRCLYGKSQLRTPFFLCHKNTPADLTPTALHLAIFFNSIHCVRLLIDAQADRSLKVLCVEVLDDPEDLDSLIEDPNPIKLTTVGLSKTLNALINSSSKKAKALESLNDSEAIGVTEDSSPSAKDTKRTVQRIFNASDLIQFASEKNIHRLTEDMVNRKVVNWKSICESYRKRLKFLVDPSTRTARENELLLTTAFDSVLATIAPLEEEHLSGVPTLRHEGDIHSAAARELAKQMNLTIASEPLAHTHSNAATPLAKPSTSTNTSNINDDDLNSDNFQAMDLKQAFRNPFHNTIQYGRLQAITDSDMQSVQTADTESVVDDDSLVSSRRRKIQAKRVRLVEWYHHGLVSKLVGQPTVYSVPRERLATNNWLNTRASTASMPSPASPGKKSMSRMASRRQLQSMINARVDDVEEAIELTNNAPNANNFSSRPATRAAFSRRQSVGQTAPLFAPLERLRSMSVRGLTLMSDPDDKPFSRAFVNPTIPQGEDEEAEEDPTSAPTMRASVLQRSASKRSVSFKPDNSISALAAAAVAAVNASTSISARQTATVTEPTVEDLQELSVLGKHSYWLSSKRLAVEEKLKIMEEVYQQKSEAERNRVYKDGRIKRKLRKRETMEARRQMFIAYLQKRIEDKIDALDHD